jgi:hypoxanthine phosphoribosyltransferase
VPAILGENQNQLKEDGKHVQLYKEVLVKEVDVNTRIAEMAAEIVGKYKGRKTLFVELLNGARPFADSLMQAIQEIDQEFFPNLQSIIISRYGPNREPGPLRIVTDLPPEYRDLTEYSVVVIDDLIDGGETLRAAGDLVESYGAEDVSYAVLVKKDKERTVVVEPLMYGFELPDKWLAGRGMDDPRIAPEANRWLGDIAIANDF